MVSRTNPYRARSNDAPERNRPPLDTARASALPLAVIAVTFFMPMMRNCDDHIVSPLDETSKSVGALFCIAPLFLASAVLCVSIVCAYTKGSRSMQTALAFVGLHVASSTVVAIASVASPGHDALWTMVALPSLVLYAIAWRRRGRRRLSLLLDAHLVAGVPLAALVAVTSSYYGGYLFAASFALFILLRAVQLAARLIRFTTTRQSL